MKSYFTKTLVILVLLALSPLTSCFCFQDGFDSVLRINTAQAVELSSATAHHHDDCGSESNGMASQSEASETNHHRSVLPCCIDNNHPSDVIAAYQSVEPVKVIPVIFPSFSQPAPKIIFQKIAYHTPDIPPPELASVRITILRL